MVSIAKKPATRILGRPPVKRAAPVPATKPRKQIDGSYIVDSRTATLVSYSVRNLEHGWACECAAAANYRACWHITEVLAAEAALASDMQLADDLAAITAYLTGAPTEEAGDVARFPDGSPRSYDESDSHVTRVRKAQETWRWDDGEI